MKIVIAPDSFKGTLTAMEVAENIELGIKRVVPEAEIYKVPMADGGEGTLQALVDAHNGSKITKRVTGPLGKTIEAEFGLLEKENTAVIEMASASGLPLISENERNPMETTTYGTGELIAAALEYDIDKIIIGIGGSATNDGGVGMAQALGVRFKDNDGNEIGFGGKELSKIDTIDLSSLNHRIKEVNVLVACDVNNPLYGANGAAYTYAPQKGADDFMVKILDENLKYFNNIINEELSIDLQSIPGSGAAGGLGGGLAAFLDAELVSGVDIILAANNMREKIIGADIVITGEGKIDGQSLQGKTPFGVGKLSREYGVPTIAIAGSIGKNAEKVLGKEIKCIFTAVHRAIPLDEAVKFTPEWLKFTAEQIMRLINL